MDADLNWNDRNSRTTHEQDDKSVRPAIAGELPDLTAYDTILIGYPIWWYREPSIIDSFHETRVVAEIVGMKAEEAVLTDGKVDLGKVHPVVFDTAALCYRTVGGSVGGAWNIGKQFE